jgi:hypothetical protein
MDWATARRLLLCTALGLIWWPFASVAWAAPATPEIRILALPTPKLILLARSPASTALKPAVDAAPPVHAPSPIIFAVRGSGRLSVTLADRVLTVADVATDDAGVVTAVAPIMGSVAPALLSDRRSLSVDVPPAAERTERIRIELAVGGLRATREVSVPTSLVDAGALPLAHTFVADVSLVDGHLHKGVEDFDDPIELSRAYTNR